MVRAAAAARAEPLPGAAQAGRGEIVGRVDELETLLANWRRARLADGGVLVLSGEPGVGKSRLVAALAEHIGGEPHATVHFFCSPHHVNSPLYPIAAEIERATDTGEHLALLAALLSLPGARNELAPALSPQQLRERTLEELVAWLHSRAREQPLLVVFEDAHWADPTSIEFLRRLGEQLVGHRILLLVTHRPGFRPPELANGRVAEVGLDRLALPAAQAIIDRVLAGRQLPAAARRSIAARSDGIPLFVEEMTMAALEAEGHAVPASLLASLTARLDRLGSAKELAQIASVIGREFRHGLLAAVAGRTSAELEAELDRLVASGLVVRDGEAYLFHHVLVQDAAYASLLRERRRALHQRIAQTIAGSEAARPELLAHHYAQAGEPQAAARYWAKAGRQALARSALVEAADQLERALGLIAALPETTELRREQAKLQVELSNALIHTRGHANLETKASFAKARAFIERTEALGEPLDDPLVPFSVLYGFWVASRMGFNGDLMRELACQMLALAESQRSPAPRMIGHMVCGISLALLGELAEGRRHLDRAIELYDPAQHRSLGTRFGHDARVTAYCWRGLAHQLLGRRDAAIRDAELALAEAREIGHAATLMFALSHVGLLFLLDGTLDDAQKLCEELIALADDKGSAYWKAYGVLLKGYHRALAGDAESALDLLRCGAAAMRSTGATAYAPWYLAGTAKALGALGRQHDARQLVGEALSAIEASNERWCEPDVRRIAAEIESRTQAD